MTSPEITEGKSITSFEQTLGFFTMAIKAPQVRAFVKETRVETENPTLPEWHFYILYTSYNSDGQKTDSFIDSDCDYAQTTTPMDYGDRWIKRYQAFEKACSAFSFRKITSLDRVLNWEGEEFKPDLSTIRNRKIFDLYPDEEAMIG